MSLDYVISADSHIIEPLDLWEKALGAKWGDKVPRVVDRYKGIPGNYYFFGYDYIDLGVVQPEDAADSTEESSAMDPELADKVNRSNQDPALRLELMEMDGVQAEIVNSTFALLCMRIEHPQLVQDVCRSTTIGSSTIAATTRGACSPPACCRPTMSTGPSSSSNGSRRRTCARSSSTPT